MSGVSRRSVLGYSGSAAAGAVLASAGPAQAEDGKGVQGAQAGEGGRAAAVAFEPGTQFSGRVQHGSGYAEVSLTFSVRHEETSGQQEISPADIAEALNDLAAKRGWPRITFYGTPPKAPLN
ncbi:twin-arginine translocation signal domain-containing protein [Streptomyces lasiicapitis]|uniref:twin-arginine translocation signal domain-containing protein n=1 Tax=Streptomyces lasiicapitis TaxID=1923961 RepID=UPI00166C2753|nr:twin-arginine translocation signal domain-containing protein [Streptomyces lasiicapitis]